MTKTVLITGCSTGFGREIAQHFLDQGWNVAATMRKPAASTFEPHDRLLVTALDVTDPTNVDAAIAATIARFGGVDAVVNNAGIGLLSAVEATPDATIRDVFETNTFGTMAVARAVIPHMRERGSGTIVNVTSSVGVGAMPLVAVYTASKWAVEGFTEALVYEVARFGIRVKLVEPGLSLTTSFGENAGERMNGLMPPEYGPFAERLFGSMRNYALTYTTEADVAEAVYAAVTDESGRLRFPAGADAVKIAELRRTLSLEDFMAFVAESFGAET